MRAGADENGIVRALDVYTLSNAGAYGEHSPTTVGLSGHKSIALYRHTEAYRFAYDVVYTNVQAAGAYRGYGATQGIYAVESAVNELAHMMHMDPVKLRELNMPMEGEPLPAYQDCGYGATQGIYAVESAVNELAHMMHMDPVKLRELNMPMEGEPLPAYQDCTTAPSCTMDQCMKRAKEMMSWDEKYPYKDMGNGKVRGVGVAMAMQGSSIAGIDVGGADMKLNEDGSYTLGLGCTDMGTGCDTILSQIAADCLETSIENIVVFGVDTDISPYDSGSYASATTYTTGMAVFQACQEMRKKICALGANIVVFGVDTDISPYDSGSYASATTYTTGMAVFQACQEMRKKICALGAKMLEAEPEEVNFDGEFVFTDEIHKVSLKDIAIKGTCGNTQEPVEIHRSFRLPELIAHRSHRRLLW